MSPLHVPLPCLLGLLHAVAVVVFGETSPYLAMTVNLPATINSNNLESMNTLPTRTDASVTSQGDSDPEVEPTVILYCLADGRMVLICESGHQNATAIQWTLDGGDLQETRATSTYNNTMVIHQGVHGNITCKVRGHTKDIFSSSIKLACEGDTPSSLFFYSVILAASGGGAFLLSMIVLSITCCCRRRSRHLSLYQEDIEMGSVFVDLETKLNAEEVNAVEETTLIINNTSPNMAPEENAFNYQNPPDLDQPMSEDDGNDGTRERHDSCAAEENAFNYQNPPDLDQPMSEDDGNDGTRERHDSCAAGSVTEGSKGEDPEERMTEEWTSGCLEN
ncbi:hypothetical protein NDU88_000595 [Pleurodeles waltl]|uniref:Ig-like domain-containing protein n=1 Tax=Pleurodeles waltl TaxID=8319 RepID=A0AAV7NAW2_PLEWA|nr:hypothetical protein NDU88_000595 [Pleurodeles waltl]